MRRALFLSLLAACAGPFEPKGTEFTPPTEWLEQTVACSQLPAPRNPPRWFVYPTNTIDEEHPYYSAVANLRPNVIYIVPRIYAYMDAPRPNSNDLSNAARVIRHEYLHVILYQSGKAKTGEHLPEYFGGIVDGKRSAGKCGDIT